MKNLALHILDIAENSVSAKASILKIQIKESLKENIYTITIEDNGIGMSQEFLSVVTDPFTTTRTTRKIGLGLPLLKQKAELCDGSLIIESEQGKGSIVVAVFKNDHIDRPPSGDIPGIVRILVSGNRDLRVVYSHITDFGDYMFDSELIKMEIGEKEFYNPLIQKYLKEMILENLSGINAS